jgi:transaldolase
MNQLEALGRVSTVAADSADFTQLAAFGVHDVTTNPSSILRAVQQPYGAPLLQRAVEAHDKRPLDKTLDELLVCFGVECLKAVPGRVSTEVDARLSFDAATTIARARRLVELYERAGVDRARVLIKIAATWEGIQAARSLEHQGIRCNLTLVFSLAQAVACGDAGVSVVSTFVGRIADWQARHGGDALGGDDAGVAVTTQVYRYFRKFGFDTQVMAASLRRREQALALAGCDLLTLPPALLADLQASDAPLQRQLDAESARAAPIHALSLNEASFRYAVNDDAMASELLADGIRRFAADARQLEQLVETRA